MQQFVFDQQSLVWIYGAGAGGTLLYKKMNENGYQIQGFIDQRAEEMKKVYHLPVYSLEQWVQQNFSKQIIMIVSVKNVFEHSRIARTLLQHGVRNIIYKPYAVLKGNITQESKKLFEIHDRVIDYGFSEKTVLDTADQIERNQESLGEYLLQKTDDTQTVFLPLCLLFENKDSSMERKERNVCFLYPHIQFFHFLQGNVDASYQHYMRYCEEAARELQSFEITDAWKQNVIKNRAEVYQQMYHSFLFNREFFIENAPDVEWNNAGYFNLKSGKHRAAFFAANRLMYMPVRVKQQEMEKWIVSESVGHVKDMIQENHILELKAPIEHPYFYEMSCSAENFFYSLCCALAEKIGQLYSQGSLDNVIENKKILVKLDDYGFIGRFFYRNGAQICDLNENDSELVDALNDMFQISKGRETKIPGHYDIAIIQIEDVSEFMDIRIRYDVRRCFVLAKENVISQLSFLEKVSCGVLQGEIVMLAYVEMANV